MRRRPRRGMRTAAKTESLEKQKWGTNFDASKMPETFEKHHEIQITESKRFRKLIIVP